MLEALERESLTRPELILAGWGHNRDATRGYEVLRDMIRVGYIQPDGAQIRPGSQFAVTRYALTDVGRAYLTVLRAARDVE